MEKIVHLYQETGYTCLCAVARMLLEAKGISMSELEIELAMKIVEGKGGSVKQLMDFLLKYGFEIDIYEDSSIKELSKTDGIKLLLFSIYDIPHVAIIKDISGGNIRLLDPSEGKTCMSLKEMEKSWFTDENKKSFISIKEI